MADGKPLVSLGIPVYNGERYIAQMLDALLTQTYENLELVICDNASTDGTEAICRTSVAQDRRIRYHRNATNIGVIANFRRVMVRSSGDFFMWAAADDIKPPNAVEQCVDALVRNPHAVMAHGIVLVRTEGGDDLVEYPNAVDLSDPSAAARIRSFTRGLQHNAMLYGLYKRAALEKATLGYCYGQDYLLCLQMCFIGPVEYVSTPIIICRERKRIPSSSVMYTEVPVTMWNLLNGGNLRRRKCWTVLLMGCYYLVTISGVCWPQRLSAIAAHMSTFCLRYRTRLAKEVVFQLFQPVAWLGAVSWRHAHRWALALRLARRVHALLTRV